jgi:hypothetical protein
MHLARRKSQAPIGYSGDDDACQVPWFIALITEVGNAHSSYLLMAKADSFARWLLQTLNWR